MVSWLGGSACLADDKAEAVKAELKRFEGTWKFVSMEFEGKTIPEAELQGFADDHRGRPLHDEGPSEEAEGHLHGRPDGDRRRRSTSRSSPATARRRRSSASTRSRATPTRSAPACPERSPADRVLGEGREQAGPPGHEAREALTVWSRRGRRRKLSGRTIPRGPSRAAAIPMSPPMTDADVLPDDLPISLRRGRLPRRRRRPPGPRGRRPTTSGPTRSGSDARQGLRDAGPARTGSATATASGIGNDGRDGARTFVLVDAAKGTRRPAFDHARLAEALGRDAGQAAEAESPGDRQPRLPRGGGGRRPDRRQDLAVRRGGRLAQAGATPLAPATVTLPLFGRGAAEVGRRTGRRGATSRPTGSGRPSSATRTSSLDEKPSGEPIPLTKDGTRGQRLRARASSGRPTRSSFVALRTEQGRRPQGLPDRVVAQGPAPAEALSRTTT